MRKKAEIEAREREYRMLWSGNNQEFRIQKFVKEAANFDSLEIKKYEELFRLLRENQRAVVPKSLGLKLLVVSDTHGYLAFGDNRFPRFMDTVGEYDLCVLLGDILPEDMVRILDCIPKEEIIAVKGNHDSFSIYSEFGVREISGESYECKGVRFAGLDGSFRYKNEEFPSHTQYESLAISRGLPQADVLLTHDIMLKDFHSDPAHSGLIGITDYIYRNRVQWHFHGHIHKSYVKQYGNGTREKSVYLCECFEI